MLGELSRGILRRPGRKLVFCEAVESTLEWQLQLFLPFADDACSFSCLVCCP